MKTVKRILILFIALSAVLCAAIVLFNKANDRFIPISFEEEVLKYSAEFDVPPVVVFSVIRCESGFDSKAESPKGAKGLMQIIPSTFNWIASLLGETADEAKMLDADTNVRYGTYYLRYLYNRFENWDHVFAAYNAGENKVASWLKDESYSKDGVLTYIPYKETREYVVRVNDTIEKYKERYKDEEWIK